MPDILLTTINAKYIHASLGLRYLIANLGALKARAELIEFTLDQRPIDIVEALLESDPKIIGFGVYIWNVVETTEVVALLKTVRPDVRIVLGGPEVSYECDSQRIVALADYLITGQGDLKFAELCAKLLAGEAPAKIIDAPVPKMSDLALPYREYTDADIAHRLIYVEASRGCPFKCEFCLSSLDKTAWPFELERFLGELDTLHERGVRHFKFVDRTFNLNVKASQRILDFFLERIDRDPKRPLFVHFELIPDHLPDGLKESIAKFPNGSLQFEIGIQTLNPDVQKNVSRKQDEASTFENLRWLREHTQAHLHVDLIVGLPGETLESFARGFDTLIALNPHEIQVGILKRLRGTPISRHTESFEMRYNPAPPYNILSNAQIDFATMQRLNRFARFWDMVGNSGRFVHTRPLLLGDAPFQRFMTFSDWIFATTSQTHQFALDRLYSLVYDALVRHFAIDDVIARDALTRDYFESCARGSPTFMINARTPSTVKSFSPSAAATRQARHRRGG